MHAGLTGVNVRTGFCAHTEPFGGSIVRDYTIITLSYNDCYLPSVGDHGDFTTGELQRAAVPHVLTRQLVEWW